MEQSSIIIYIDHPSIVAYPYRSWMILEQVVENSEPNFATAPGKEWRICCLCLSYGPIFMELLLNI